MPKHTSIRFGTDGWRARIAEEYTFENVRACAAGVASYLWAQGMADRGLVVGYDTRFGSRAFASEVARVSATYGVPTYLCDRVTPTPVASYAILDRGAGGAVVITASHNPAAWNGFKYKPHYAGSATPSVVAQLENRIAQAQINGIGDLIGSDEAQRRGLLVSFDATAPYLANIARSMDLAAVRTAGLRIAVDSMYGAGAGFLAGLLEGNVTSVTEFRSEPHPGFPGMAQPEPIAANLELLSSAVCNEGFDVALATDGDADRIGILDEQGTFITTLHVFSLLCLHLLELRKQRGPLVRSLTQSAMLAKLGRRYEVPVHTTPVGFKFLGPAMIESDALAAGEESGGYAFRGNIPERDGIFSGLLFLELMVKTGKRPSELVQWLHELVGPHYYDRWDIALPSDADAPSVKSLQANAATELGGMRVVDIDASDGIRFLFEDGFWGLVRSSGTEPLIRLYAEAPSPDVVQRVLHDLRAIARV